MIFDAASALRANATHRPASTVQSGRAEHGSRLYFLHMIPTREWVATGNGRRV